MIEIKAIVNGKILLKDRVLENHVVIFDKKILDIIPVEEFSMDNIEIIDANGNYVSSGFIDLHIHGYAGYDTMDASFKGLCEISKSIVRNGVTSFLPTTMTMSKEVIYNALENVKYSINKITDGAKIQGVHLEGPFISSECKGAQDEKHILKPSYDFIKPYLDIVKLITYAPEQDDNMEFLKIMSKHKDITLSIGHTNATFEEAIEAINNGANYVTHTFNGMSGLHHRNPGVVGAVFASDIYCEIIADGIHVHKGLFEPFININGKDKVILITDCIRAGGMKDGLYDLGGQEVKVENRTARLSNGTLAGSILKLNEAVKNIRDNTKFNLYEIINMVSLNQAKVLGLDDELGSIEKGKLSDIVMFNEDIDIKMTIINGKTVFKSKEL